MGKKLVVICGALLVLAGGWYWGSPRWTLHQMSSAAEARDGQKLASYIDFPPLRESVKAQFKGQMAARLAVEQESNPFAALGAMLAMGMVDAMVEGMLTPQAMEAMFAVTPPSPTTKPAGLSAKNTEIRYDGLNQFRLIPRSPDSGGGAIVFTRHGLGWKMSDIRLPNDLTRKRDGESDSAPSNRGE